VVIIVFSLANNSGNHYRMHLEKEKIMQLIEIGKTAKEK
jgi:hypothetical protein